jgi:hypothetical protein
MSWGEFEFGESEFGEGFSSSSSASSIISGSSSSFISSSSSNSSGSSCVVVVVTEDTEITLYDILCPSIALINDLWEIRQLDGTLLAYSNLGNLNNGWRISPGSSPDSFVVLAPYYAHGTTYLLYVRDAEGDCYSNCVTATRYSSSGSSEEVCWIPPNPVVTDITETSAIVHAPAVFEYGYLLNLEIREDGEEWRVIRYNVGPGETVTIIDLPEGTWFTIRWAPVFT